MDNYSVINYRLNSRIQKSIKLCTMNRQRGSMFVNQFTKCCSRESFSNVETKTDILFNIIPSKPMVLCECVYVVIQIYALPYLNTMLQACIITFYHRRPRPNSVNYSLSCRVMFLSVTSFNLDPIIH
jgi:hypothetical protein